MYICKYFKKINIKDLVDMDIDIQKKIFGNCITENEKDTSLNIDCDNYNFGLKIYMFIE